MNGYRFIDRKGTFELQDPELTSYLYFPIANEYGVMSSITPTLGGDNKLDQNKYLLEPVSSEGLHNNRSTRNFWCHIKNKEIWSATGNSPEQQMTQFTQDKDATILQAGLMWHEITRKSEKYGITATVRSFVPCNDVTAEIMTVTLNNHSNETIQVTPTAAIPIYGRSADNIRDHRHVTSLLHRIETRQRGVIVNPTLTFDERGHQENTMIYGVFGGTDDGQLPVGFFPVMEDYIGEGGTLEYPIAILDETIKPVKEGYHIDGYEAMGGIRFETVNLDPNEKKTYIIVMGYGTSVSELEITATKFFEENAHRGSLDLTKSYWENQINISYESGSPEFDAWMTWVSLQPILRRIYGCSFLPHHDYGKGGRGWRDLWQDCLSLLFMKPDGVKQMILDNFAGVRVDGTNATIIGKNQGEFIADRNNITRVWMDHGVWPFLTTRLYIMQSGDLEILLTDIPYFKDIQTARGTDQDTKWNSNEGNLVLTEDGSVYEGSVLEHMLIQHLTAFYDVGEHNHMKLRNADWNDALDMASERGESVAFTTIYSSNMEQMADLIQSLYERGMESVPILKELELLLEDDIRIYDDPLKKQNLLKGFCGRCIHTVSGKRKEISCTLLVNNLRSKATWIKNYVRVTEWITNEEGHSWYNGYYDNSGKPVEGDHVNGTRMMLTSQVFSIMSGIATDEQVIKIVDAADTYLYDKSMGGYKLNTDFKEVKKDFGRMFGFAYGHKENGSVFSHMAIMYANALYQRGFVKEGYKAIKSLFDHSRDFSKSKIYPGIAEYYNLRGTGMYHYLTGSASWLLLTVLTQMYGVKGNMGNLQLEPKLMLEQFDENHRAKVELNFCDRNLVIEYSNPEDKEYGQYEVSHIVIKGKKYDCQLGANSIRREDIVGINSDEKILIQVELK